MGIQVEIVRPREGNMRHLLATRTCSEEAQGHVTVAVQRSDAEGKVWTEEGDWPLGVGHHALAIPKEPGESVRLALRREGVPVGYLAVE